MLKSDLNLLGYALFPSKALPEWKSAFYLPMSSPRGSHFSFFMAGNLAEDICFAPVLALLKERNPEMVIWIFTDHVGEQIFRDNPNVDRVILIPLERWRKTIWDKAQEEMANWIITYRQGLGWVCNLSGHPACALLARLMGGKRAFGLLMDEDGRPVIVGNRWMQYAMEVLYPEISDGVLWRENIMGKKEMISLALGLHPAGTVSNNSMYIRQSSELDLFPFVRDPFVAISPVGNTEVNTWPIEYWKRLIKLIRQVYLINIVVIDTSPQEDLMDWQEEGVFIVKTQDIARIAFLLARAKMFVSAYNGLIHLSGSLSIPTMVICGPRSKAPSFAGLHLSVRKDVPCAPCTLSTCSRRYCLTHLTPEQAFDVFRFHWDVIKKGDFSPELLRERNFGRRGLIVEFFSDRLPDIMYPYLPLTDDYTDEIISRISRIAYLHTWNISNVILVKENIPVDFSRYIDWILEQDVEWSQFESAVRSQIRTLKEWEQRLSLLVVRLNEIYPPFPFSLFKSNPIDPENLWDSLVSFDNSMPSVLKKLSCEEWEEGMSYSERIRYWLKVKKILLSLMHEYREFMEQFVFSRKRNSERVSGQK